jgi:cytochrome c
MFKLVGSLAITAFLLSTAAFAEGDADKGKKVFKKCKACHAVGEGAKNKIGPALNGIVGKPAGQNSDFKYSKAMIAKIEEGLVWDEASLTAFVSKPKKFMKGTKMAFNGIKKEKQISDLIAYLSSFE